MSWEEHHRRHRVLDGVLAEVARTGLPVIPVKWAEPIAETFGDEEAFLAALGYRWLNRLTARLDELEADQPGNVSAAVQRLLAAEQPELPAVLAAYAHRPAVVAARAAAGARCGRVGPETAWQPDSAPGAVTA